MKLIDDFKTVLLKSWAVRFSALSALLGAIVQFQAQLPALQGLVPTQWYSLAAIICAVAAALARLIHQESSSGPQA